jgi:hypothetical protein
MKSESRLHHVPLTCDAAAGAARAGLAQRGAADVQDVVTPGGGGAAGEQCKDDHLLVRRIEF